MADPSSGDYYKVLGVGRSATQDQIKKAYKKAAMRYHPDKNQGDPQAEENFKKVAEAFDVLSDDQKRAAYNRWGKDGARIAEQRGNGPQGFRGGVDPDELFRQFFGANAARQGGGGPTFFFNGVPVNLSGFGQPQRPAGNAAAGGPPGENPFDAIKIPPVIQNIIEAVPPPLLVVGGMAAIAVGIQLFSAVMSVAMTRMHVILPIFWFAPSKHRPALLLGAVALAMLDVI